MLCVIWTNPCGGLCNMDRCYKWQYLYKVLGKCFIGYIYKSIVQYCTITAYEYDTTRIGTLAHAFWVRVSFPEVRSLREAGRRDAVRVFISALFKLTATITQEKPFLQYHRFILMYFLKCIQNMTFSLGVMFAVTKCAYVRKLGMLRKIWLQPLVSTLQKKFKRMAPVRCFCHSSFFLTTSNIVYFYKILSSFENH